MATRQGFNRQRKQGPQRGARQRRQAQGDPTNRLKQEMAQEAQDLGLPQGHVQRVAEAGPRAISEWVQEVDNSGAVARIMRLSQQFGNWLEERVARGRQPQQSEMEQAIIKLADKFGVPEDIAQQVMMETMTRLKQASGGQVQQGQSGQQQPTQSPQGGNNGNQTRV